MSHYSEMQVETKIANEEEFIEALKSVFGDVEVYDKPADLKMYYGGLSGLKANIIVRMESQGKAVGKRVLSNDLGFERSGDGYKCHADKAGYPKELQDKVNADYAERVATKQLKKQGYMVKRTTLEDGRVKLTASKW